MVGRSRVIELLTFIKTYLLTKWAQEWRYIVLWTALATALLVGIVVLLTYGVDSP